MTNPQTVMVLSNGARVTLDIAIEDVHADFKRRFDKMTIVPGSAHWWEPIKSTLVRLDHVIAIAAAETVNMPARKTETVVQRDDKTREMLGSIAIEADA